MNEITTTAQNSLLPSMTIVEAIDRRNAIIEFTKSVMKKDTDYGVIPGTGTKPTLLKPGAEKLLSLFGLSSSFELVESEKDWMGHQHGQAFFYFSYRCILSKDGQVVANGEGSCNSFEKKYRYRQQSRVCPKCGKETIIKGKEEYGGGWLCFQKKGGCGAKFRTGDASIESQNVGQVPNEDIADQVNTIQKMAQKRAMIAATLIAVNASEFFTQDVEDMRHINVSQYEEAAVVNDDEYPLTVDHKPAPIKGIQASLPPMGTPAPEPKASSLPPLAAPAGSTGPSSITGMITKVGKKKSPLGKIFFEVCALTDSGPVSFTTESEPLATEAKEAVNKPGASIMVECDCDRVEFLGVAPF